MSPKAERAARDAAKAAARNSETAAYAAKIADRPRREEVLQQKFWVSAVSLTAVGCGMLIFNVPIADSIVLLALMVIFVLVSLEVDHERRNLAPPGPTTQEVLSRSERKWVRTFWVGWVGATAMGTAVLVIVQPLAVSILAFLHIEGCLFVIMGNLELERKHIAAVFTFVGAVILTVALTGHAVFAALVLLWSITLLRPPGYVLGG